MILHAASIAAFFAAQLAQTPVVVQCASATPESPWKWIIQSVIPVAGGTLIAVWSFVQNRSSEQEQWERNQKAAHDQWIRDQKKADWRELLKMVSALGNTVPLVSKQFMNYEQVAEQIIPAINRVDEACANCLFLAGFFSIKENNDHFLDFLNTATVTASKILSPDHRIRLKSGTDEDALAVSNERYALVVTFRETCVTFAQWLQDNACEDLGFKKPKQ
jgi:uncharacterized membrane protein YozB (DUF420 family)